MFQNTNDELRSPQNPNKNYPNPNQPNPEPKKNPEVEKATIHTMREDLKNLASPGARRNEAESNSSSVKSPFLSQESWNDKEENWKKEEQLYLKEEKSEAPKKHRGLGKVILFAVIIFVVIAAGGGGYYFWLTRMNAVEEEPAEMLPEPTPSVEESEALPDFSQDKPNYLSLDMVNFDRGQIKTILNDYALKVSETNSVLPVEFIITDASNNPVTFQDFSAKLGLGLSENVLSQLGSNFSLYIYNDIDGGETRLGLSVSSQENNQLGSILLKEEAGLTQELESLYLASSYTLPDKTFASSIYEDVQIRYINIISPENLSVDYAVYKNQLLIGTTKMTLRSIIDYLNRPETISENQEVPEIEENSASGEAPPELPSGNNESGSGQTVDNL